MFSSKDLNGIRDMAISNMRNGNSTKTLVDLDRPMDWTQEVTMSYLKAVLTHLKKNGFEVPEILLKDLELS